LRLLSLGQAGEYERMAREEQTGARLIWRRSRWTPMRCDLHCRLAALKAKRHQSVAIHFEAWLDKGDGLMRNGDRRDDPGGLQSGVSFENDWAPRARRSAITMGSQ
jgi:hypothetical protein